MMPIRRTITAITLAAALPAVMGACGNASGDGSRFLSIGTGGTGGIYYPLGGALANRLSDGDPDRRYTAEVSGGAVENVNRVLNGDIDLGLAIGTTVHHAYDGGADGADRIRIVAPLYPNMTHVLVSRRSGLESLADARGRRVSVGAPGSGTEQLSRELLQAYGLTYDDIDEQYLSFAESSSALRDGAIDAAILSVGYPASAVLEAITNGNVRLLAIESEIVERLSETRPYYSAGVIPGGAYPEHEADLATVGVMNWVVATEDLPDEVATRLLGILRDQRDYLAQVHGVTRQIRLDALRDAPIPLHPAAERWLASEEAGAGAR